MKFKILALVTALFFATDVFCESLETQFGEPLIGARAISADTMCPVPTELSVATACTNDPSLATETLSCDALDFLACLNLACRCVFNDQEACRLHRKYC